VKRIVDVFQGEVFDVLVLGGGITGAGVALDAVLRGFRVALIDKGDFASGTSSVSSKLVHGGLRYLEHGALRLVHEALHERGLLLCNAPHLVQPLRFIIPFYSGARVRPWQWRAALTLYDFLAGRKNIHRSRPEALSRLKGEFPGFRIHGLRGGAEYYDAQMDDARLCLEVVRTAVQHGCVAANYVEALAFELRGGEIAGVRAVDRIAGQELTIEARQVINATGPWTDTICRLAGDTAGPRLQPTKGVHLIAPGRGLQTAFLLLHPADGRVFFVIPWMGKTLLGTTDTFPENGPDSLSVTPQDVTYLLEGHNHYFEPALQPPNVQGSFAGLRPLIRARPGEPSSLSREFRVFTSPSGLLTVAGGKYTTYRHMARVITDAIARRLGRRRLCRTQNCLLDGTPRQPWANYLPTTSAHLAKHHGLNESSARHLVQRYGRRAAEVAAYLDEAPALTEPVVPGEPDLLVEYVYQRNHEMAMTPADFLLRRTRLGLWHPELMEKGGALLEPVLGTPGPRRADRPGLQQR
jgi:glycerol-3-phosphate dehydrogenase